MPTLDEIRTLTIKAVSDGLDKATADLNKLAEAQGGVAVASDTTSKSSTSVSSALERQQRSLDTNYRSQVQFNKAQLDITRAYNDGMLSTERYNDLTALNTQRLNDSAKAHGLLSGALSGVRGQLVALAGGAGPVGVFLSGLGPWGVAAAAGIGGAIAAMNAMSSAADQLASKAQGLRSFALVTGLATGQIQSLREAGSDFAISGEEVSSFVERFTTQLSDTRNATGAYYDKLREINPELARQALTTKGVADQINILAAAYKQAGVEGNSLLKAAGGRGGVAVGPLISAVGDAGGVGNLPGSSAALTQDQIESFSKLKAAADSAGEHIRDNLSQIFSGAILQNQKESRETIEGWSRAIRDFSPSDAFWRFADWFDRATGGKGGQAFVPNLVPTPAYPPQTSGLEGPAQPAAGPSVQAIANSGKATIGALGSGASEAEKLTQRINELNVALKEGVLTQDQYNRAVGAAGLQTAITLESARIGLLGQAAPLTELLRQKQDEINAARQKGASISAEEARTVLAAVASQRLSSDTALLTTNNVVTAEQLRATKLTELNVLLAQHKLTQDQVTTSAKAYELVIEQTIQQQEVAKSQLPGLTQLQQQAGNARTQLDQFATTSLNSVSPALQDMMNGTTTLSAGFQNLGLTVVKALENMIIQMTIIQPIAAALKATLSSMGGGFNLSSLFGGGSSSGPTSIIQPGTGGMSVPTFHTGGMIGVEGGSARYVHPSYFDDAPRFHSGGIAGDEVPIIARRGEGVFTQGQMAALGGGTASPVVNINVANYGNDSVAVGQPKQNGDGSIDIEVMVGEMAAKQASKPGSTLSNTLNQRGRLVAR